MTRQAVPAPAGTAAEDDEATAAKEAGVCAPARSAHAGTLGSTDTGARMV